ncbi:MAG TPA: DUF5677 domain-containing protein [Dongiaceae bacterium]|nr:DUF5677 domain-containing protein [Dongiaceae bacterium]
MSFDSNTPLAALVGDVAAAPRDAGERLLLAVQGVPSCADKDARLLYVREQARSVAAVALDIHVLLTNNRLQNIVGLCRVAFESRINLCAAMRVPDFAAQKFIAQAQSNLRELEEVANGARNPQIFRQAFEHHRQLLQEMRQSYCGVKERAWKIKEAAEAAGLLDDHNEYYSMLSKAAHNTPAGLLSKEEPRVMATSVLRLLHDTLEAAHCLVFFRERDDATPQPVTLHWEHLIEPLEALRQQYAVMQSRLGAMLSSVPG